MASVIAGRTGLEDWISIVLREATSRWTNGRLLLLSQIPAVLRGNGIEPSEIQGGRPLLTALKVDSTEVDGSRRLQCVQNPENSAVWAAVPPDVAAANDPQTIFAGQSPVRTVLQSPTSVRLFKPWFWAAFVKNIENGMRRWILRNQYLDTMQDARLSTGIAEVLVADVINPGQDIPVDRGAVLRSIENWAKRNSIDLAQFEAPAPVPHKRDAAARIEPLDFESLDAEDLKRITIPLDIVFKLLRR